MNETSARKPMSWMNAVRAGMSLIGSWIRNGKKRRVCCSGPSTPSRGATKGQGMDVSQVANYMILASGGKLTHMQLQKLVYIAHGFALAQGKRLIENNVQAWKYGPVIRDLYTVLRDFGDQAVSSPVCTGVGEGGKLEFADEISDAELKEIVDAVLDSYGRLSGIQLSAMTHKHGTPWQTTYREIVPGVPMRDQVIPEPVIKSYYETLIESRSSGTG